MTPAPAALHAAAEATWPPAHRARLGPVTLRDGAGGGKRVSAATAAGPVTHTDLDRAEAAMRDAGQVPLFQLRAGDEGPRRDARGAGLPPDRSRDHMGRAVAALTAERPPRLTTFTIWEPLAIMRDIWAEGGIGPARIAVMERAAAPRTGLFARHADQPAGAGFVACHAGVAMVHALEVRARHRRAGVGRLMLRQAALWAEGARRAASRAALRAANEGSNALCAAMGFSARASYHYRLKEEP